MANRDNKLLSPVLLAIRMNKINKELVFLTLASKASQLKMDCSDRFNTRQHY